MSHPEYFAPCVEITELICIFKVVRSEVFVVTLPWYPILFPPTTSLTQMVASFCGCTPTTMHEYVTVRPTGILLLEIKIKWQKIQVWKITINIHMLTYEQIQTENDNGENLQFESKYKILNQIWIWFRLVKKEQIRNQ